MYIGWLHGKLLTNLSNRDLFTPVVPKEKIYQGRLLPPFLFLHRNDIYTYQLKIRKKKKGGDSISSHKITLQK